MKLWKGEEILVYFQTACIDVLVQLLLEKKEGTMHVMFVSTAGKKEQAQYDNNRGRVK